MSEIAAINDIDNFEQSMHGFQLLSVFVFVFFFSSWSSTEVNTKQLK